MNPKYKYVVFAVVAICYPLGEFLQEHVLSAPQFLRHHLSDFGFVPYHSLKGCILWLFIDKMNPKKFVEWVWAGMIASLFIALVSEFIAITDWIDVVSYFAGFGIGFWCIHKTSHQNSSSSSGISSRFKGDSSSPQIES